MSRHSPGMGAILVTLGLVAVGLAAFFAYSRQNGGTIGHCPFATQAPVAGTIGSAAGQGPLTRGSAPPWPPTPSSPPVPTVENGRVFVTDANSHQQITVPKGTIVEIHLSARGWTPPRSSDATLLPRLSSTSNCDGSVDATFSALGSGSITAVGGGNSNHGGPTITFEVKIESS
jgi:hypothetical protein